MANVNLLLLLAANLLCAYFVPHRVLHILLELSHLVFLKKKFFEIKHIIILIL